MTPPEETPPTDAIRTVQHPLAVSSCLEVLRTRADFLRAARARKQPTTGMLVQGRKRPPGEAEGIRVGFTCSKKVGNAVTRNRAKRRLRAVARAVLPELGCDGWDYVLVGRAGETVTRPFDALVDDLRYAVRRLHGGGRR